jgi:hypothetical protein
MKKAKQAAGVAAMKSNTPVAGPARKGNVFHRRLVGCIASQAEHCIARDVKACACTMQLSSVRSPAFRRIDAG